MFIENLDARENEIAEISSEKKLDQVTKGIRRIPWDQEPMKDVA
jgi:hypothetical protein